MRKKPNLAADRKRKSEAYVEVEEPEIDVHVSSEAVELIVGNRLDGETDRAVVACNDYIRMGAGRTIVALQKFYVSLEEEGNGSGLAKAAPSTSLQTMRNWSFMYGWGARAELFDAEVESAKTDYARKVLETGLATRESRVESLKRLAHRLEIEMESRLWGVDWRVISKIDVRKLLKLNAQLITQYRGVLDDIAAETNGRRKGLELTGADGGPVDITDGTRTLLFSRLLSGAAENGEGEAAPGTDG